MEPSHGIGSRPQGVGLLKAGRDAAETPGPATRAGRVLAGIIPTAGTARIARSRFSLPRLCFLLCGAACIGARAFDPGRIGFSVAYKGENSAYRVNAVFLLPGETLELRAESRDSGSFALWDSAGRALPAGPRRWSWRAPDSAGMYPFRIARAAGDTMQFHAFVMVPVSEMRGEYLRGYRIGKYPRAPLHGLAFYSAPEGYIRLDSATQAAALSPHFRLGQFACKQTPALPGYLALKERLLLKLELVLEKANQAGYACESFHVMSGYRTPFYNRMIGNVKLSAHQYGGAADIFIDANPEDGEMDDLNGDGRSDGDDSGLLFKLVDEMSLNGFFLPYIGGIGKYSKNESHGAFVHVDVRGFRAIW